MCSINYFKVHVESEIAVPQSCSKLLLTGFSIDTGMTPQSKRFYKTGGVNHLA